MSSYSDYADAVSRILQQQGQARARGALARGQAWAGFAQQLGQLPSQLIDMSQQAKARELEDQWRKQQIESGKALEEERTQLTADRQRTAAEETEQRRLTKAIHDQAEQAYQTIKGGNADEVFATLAPEARVIAEGWYKNFAAGQQARQAQAQADAKQAAVMIQRLNYDPVVAGTAIKLLGDVHPSAKEALDHATDPAKLKRLVDYYATLGDKPPEPYTLPQGAQRRDPITNQLVAENPPEPPVKPPPAAGSFEAHLERVAKGRGITVADLSERQVLAEKTRYEAAGRAPVQGDRTKFWVVRDGKTIRIGEGDYRPGDTPASTREQGRPVTAADASDLADFDTSLDELAAVRAAIAPTDSTGIVARVGAKLPYVTQITGWGEDAKKRQAVIDRVKQVIGKTLEGGVLRKEDEAKYEKILPNIGDAPAVAVSKLDGLDAAIKKRKQRRLDNLADANYDVSKQATRDAAKNASDDPPLRRPIPGVTGGIAESTDGGKTWRRVK